MLATDHHLPLFEEPVTERLHPRVDATLLGGAVIRAGDLVIDGSVKGRLAKLAASL